jgi:hypothetical protein
LTKWSRRGQVLVVAALAIALTILSTQAYVYRLSRTRISPEHNHLCDYVLCIEQGSSHAVTASLVNVSRGGATSNLRANLDRWESFVAADYSLGRCELNATPASEPPYSEGVWLDWGIDGEGVSSAWADFTMNLSGMGVEVDDRFTVNVTTRVIVSGSYTTIENDNKEIAMVVNLLNEAEPALSGSIGLEYLESPGQWLEPTQIQSYTDYGNGTYRYIFTESVAGTEVQVRAQVTDQRGVFVQAEATLVEG